MKGVVTVSRYYLKRILSLWKNISVIKKLYIVVGTMAFLILFELFTLHIAMKNLSAVRSFVGGEGMWSKAQKNAFYHFQRYALTKNEKDYQDIESSLKVIDGDRVGRRAILNDHPNPNFARENFIQGKIHPDDVDSTVNLLKNFAWISYLEKAIASWEKGDRIIDEFRVKAKEYHDLILSGQANAKRAVDIIEEMNVLNERVTAQEEEFSTVLGEGSRWMEGLIFSVLFLMVLTIESVGLTLTFITSQGLSKGLFNLNKLAEDFGHGDFSRRLEVSSRDEIGLLTISVNRMGSLLEKSYNDLRISYQNLEKKIWSRTAELAQKSEENVRLYKKATEALKMRDEFLSIANHELRTPLTALNLQLHLLERSLDHKELKIEYVKEMTKKSNRMLKKLISLHDVLMDLTHIQQGKFELNLENCDLVVIANDCVTQLNLEAQKRAAKIQFSGPAAMFGKFDSLRASQVITNLLSNAIKYGDGGAIELCIVPSTEKVSIIVKDDGPGIPLEIQDKIFERYERASGDHTISGLGLGLYITRQIVEAHGGNIQVKSNVGEGAIFLAEFPLS